MSLQDQYRAERAAVSGSAIYRTQAPVQRPNLYESVAPKTLQEYAQATPPGKFAQRSGESDISFTRRLRPWLNHLADELDQAQVEVVMSTFREAEARIEGGGALSFQDLRQHLDGRTSEGGLFGTSSPVQRAQAYRQGNPMTNSMSESVVPMRGGMTDSVGPAPARVYASQIEQTPLLQRPEIPTSSSGEGWSTSRG